MTTNTLEFPSSEHDGAESLREKIRAAIELLEALDADRGLLAALPAAEYQRFIDLTRRVSNPDHLARRRLVKAVARERKAARVRQDESLLGATGIRELRRKPVFTTPN